MTQSRGTIVIDGTATTLKLISERVNLRTGLFNLAVPITNSESNFNYQVGGRGKEIVLEGWFSGTQLEVEAFIKIFEDWLNQSLDVGTTATYFPMFHADNNTGGNMQDSSFNVMSRDWQYTYEEREPSRITYVLTLVEGSKGGFFSDLSGAE